MGKFVNFKKNGQEIEYVDADGVPYTFKHLLDHKMRVSGLDDEDESFEDAAYTPREAAARRFYMVMGGLFAAMLISIAIALFTPAFTPTSRPLGMPADMCFTNDMPHIEALSPRSITYVNTAGDYIYAEHNGNKLTQLIVIEADLCR